MIKTIGIASNIEDLKEFEAYFFNKVLPFMLQAPGVSHVNITSVMPMSQENVEEYAGMQVIIETHYESYDYLRDTINSELGQKIIVAASQIPSGKISLFMGKEKKVFPSKRTTQSLKDFDM